MENIEIEIQRRLFRNAVDLRFDLYLRLLRKGCYKMAAETSLEIYGMAITGLYVKILEPIEFYRLSRYAAYARRLSYKKSLEWVDTRL